jgi:hypothetical protein
MSETAPATQQTRRSDLTSDKTATSLTAAGMGAFLLWIFGMIDAHQFFVPPVETAMFMGAALLPITHALGARWVRKLNRDTGGTPGVNGGSPPAPLPIEPGSGK